MKHDRSRGAMKTSPFPSLHNVWLLHFLYDLCYVTLLVVLLPLFAYKLATSRRARAGLGQRLGWIPRRLGGRPCIWIHGVSVGEVKAAVGLIKALPEQLPEWELVLSTTTLQGYQVARKEHPDILTFYYPLDFSLVTRRSLRRIRPNAVVLMELELWPNFLLECNRMGIPVCLVNGRISVRSYHGYRLARRFLPEPHQRIRFYAVQNEDYAARIRHLGVRPDMVHVTGQMKYDIIQADPERVPELRRHYRKLLGIAERDWVLIGGSTHPTEEETLLGVVKALPEAGDRSVRVILVPRHLERLHEVEECIQRAGLSVVRRTQLPDGSPEKRTNGAAREGAARTRPAVVLVDTVGELAQLYAAADLVFVGGSLIPHGGQSMIEPAILGLPVVFGPHVWNFSDSVRALREAGAAVQVADREELGPEVERLYLHPEQGLELGRRARHVVTGLQGATHRNVALIVGMLRT